MSEPLSENREYGFPIGLAGYHPDEGGPRLVPGKEVRGDLHSTKIGVAGVPEDSLPIGTFHTHPSTDKTQEGFAGAATPHSVADLGIMAGSTFIRVSFVLSGSLSAPKLFLAVKTTEFEEQMSRWRPAIMERFEAGLVQKKMGKIKRSIEKEMRQHDPRCTVDPAIVASQATQKTAIRFSHILHFGLYFGNTSKLRRVIYTGKKVASSSN